MALWGEGVGGRRDPHQGRVLLLSGGCCLAQGCSQLHVTPRTLTEAAFQEAHQGRGYLEGKVLSRVCAFGFLLWLGGNSNAAVRFGQEKETPRAFH